MALKRSFGAWLIRMPSLPPSLQCILRMPPNASALPKCTFEISIVTLLRLDSIKWIEPIPNIHVTFSTDKERHGAIPFDLKPGSANNQYVFEFDISQLNWQKGFFVGLAIISTAKYLIQYEDHSMQPPLGRQILTERKCSIKVIGPLEEVYGKTYRVRGRSVMLLNF